MDDSVVTLVQPYIPLISSPIVFLIAVFFLGRLDKREGAWEFFARPFTASCKRISVVVIIRYLHSHYTNVSNAVPFSVINK